jgi:hypothetical protein
MVAYAGNPSTLEAEAEVHEFEASLRYMAKPRVNKPKNQTNQPTNQPTNHPTKQTKHYRRQETCHLTFEKGN